MAKQAKQAQSKTELPRKEKKFITLKIPEESRPVGLVPPSFPPDYVAGSAAPFILSSAYFGETPSLPMIDLALSKEKAIPIQWQGILYEGWVPNPEEEGTTVFLSGYENRGPNNERKRIYMSAVTPDLIDTKYRHKFIRFYERFFAEANAGKPMMEKYFESYDDLYWDLHVGATGVEVPLEARQFSKAFRTVLGYFYPTSEIHRDAFILARNTRPKLRAWLDGRVQRIIDGKPNADQTFVYYWLKNGELGENFRRIDIVFECIHNFLALSQWGNMIYHVAQKLESTHGDPNVQAWFKKTMKNRPDQTDDSPFTPLDRFVMELFRTINPNGGSLSTLKRSRHLLTSEFSNIITPHLEASMAPRHWENPAEFDPDRYKTARTSTDNDEMRCREIGLARCPFSKESFQVKDGRNSVEMTNSGFGAVYSEIDGKPQPLVDTAGYAPFGFGYRRCAGEHITVEFIKEYLRAIWKEDVSFIKLDIEKPGQVPVNPETVLNDDIAFRRAK